MIKEKDNRNNKAIGRKEIVYTITHEKQSQPSRKELEKQLKVKIKEKHFIIRKIKSRFGKPESEVTVHAYKDEKTMKYYEPKHLFSRVKEEKKEEPKPEVEEEKKEESKVEEPKTEEKKVEKVEEKKEEVKE